ncbi:MAG: IS5 family transposase [Spirochaetes bacterium]|nr:MAG: IS5 family transposase [Spirochaetota bacterium]
MHRTKQNKKWKRYKKVDVPWAQYDNYRINECGRILDLSETLEEIDYPVQRREFKLSRLAILLLFKILFNVSYRTIASAVKDLHIYHALGMKRAPCYKTIQNTMAYFDDIILSKINRKLLPSKTFMAAIDSSGMKTNRRGTWVIIRFKRVQRRRDFRKVHIFVDLASKKIIYCIVTRGTSSDSKQLKKILNECKWMKVEIILGDGGYDTRECFNEIEKHGSLAGIKIRKNACARARGSPARREAVLAQKKDYNEWKERFHYTMRCVVESIFSGAKRRFGDSFFSIKEKYRMVEMWLKTILWNVLIYPR